MQNRVGESGGGSRIELEKIVGFFFGGGGL